MKPTKLMNPSRNTMQLMTSIEPWQRDAMQVLRDDLGIDGDALIRAGLTLVLCIVGASTPGPAEIDSNQLGHGE
jgi:hypothetical protein